VICQNLSQKKLHRAVDEM
jgi:hypothetical protein